MRSRRRASRALRFLLLLAFNACGGGGGSSTTPDAAPISTLAYVVSECRSDSAESGTIRQSLQIRKGDQGPITVTDIMSPTTSVLSGYCAYTSGVIRAASDFADYGVFHRLGVTPDGSQIAFEVTDDPSSSLQLIFPPNSLPEKRKGIFAVLADGTDLRWLGPASREPISVANSGPAFTFAFSPDGRTIAYTDRGPSLDNQDAVQIFTLDLATADRRQITQLPPATPRPPARTCCPIFVDNTTISFITIANVDGTNPDNENVTAIVKTDGTGLRVARPAVAIPGSEILTSFQITGEVSPFLLRVPGTPVNPGGLGAIQEVFVTDGQNVLQLTSFRRQDTWNPTLSADGQRVFFAASVDPPSGTNPSENCQVFSIDVTGGDLHQVSDFHEGPHSPTGCHSGRPPEGCTVFYLGRDAPSDTLLFHSTCNPLGGNPYGVQLFAMRPDGTGLRQLTDTHGYQSDRARGAVSFEAPFPWAHPGQRDG